MADKIKFVLDDNNSENELKHYGVLGMKWGVRKERYYELKGPISNKYYEFANRNYFKNGVKGLKASSSSLSSTRSSGSRYTFQFNKTKFDSVKAWKKKSGGSGGKKGSGTKAKAEKALKEKIDSASKKSSAAKGGGKASGSKSSSKESNIESDKKTISVDPDFNEKYFNTKNKLGSTNFYAYKNDKGQMIISDKTNKWILPNSVIFNKKVVTSQLEQFESKLNSILKSTGHKPSKEEKEMWTTAVMNKIISGLKDPQKDTNQQIADYINNLFSDKDKSKKSEDGSFSGSLKNEKVSRIDGQKLTKSGAVSSKKKTDNSNKTNIKQDNISKVLARLDKNKR